ncbi:MAG TPA: exodeoxyribonuclease I [Gammaproteobacteria bacterium]|nr:exodeoxyribonuclease I [Gammaproteobacteria bacterium]
MMNTLYWHDYETSGLNPRFDRPVQFAGLRTNLELEEVDTPLNLYSLPPKDILPHPQACLITGITPQLAAARGIREQEFIHQIHEQLSRPGTCGVGYNSIRFDDEVTRFTLYRNFFDPYAREWQNGNSRWDLIDLVRMTYALRPEGIQWPRNDAGDPVFRLDHLSIANGIAHDNAHDALADVRATLELARLIYRQQPRLYAWLFRLRDKRKVGPLLNVRTHEPVVHSSRMYPSSVGATTLVMPLIKEPNNSNGVLVYDLRIDPAPFLPLNQEELSFRLFTARKDLPEGVSRLPVKTVRYNKCPALAPRDTLDPESASRIHLSPENCQKHWQQLMDNPAFFKRVAKAYSGRTVPRGGDVDGALYDGFLNNADRTLMAQVRHTPAGQLANMHIPFTDSRLSKMLFRYRARNWPELLTTDEQLDWQQFRHKRLCESNDGQWLSITEYTEQLTDLRQQHADNPDQISILDVLGQWGDSLLADVAAPAIKGNSGVTIQRV